MSYRRAEALSTYPPTGFAVERSVVTLATLPPTEGALSNYIIESF